MKTAAKFGGGRLQTGAGHEIKVRKHGNSMTTILRQTHSVRRGGYEQHSGEKLGGADVCTAASLCRASPYYCCCVCRILQCLVHCSIVHPILCVWLSYYGIVTHSAVWWWWCRIIAGTSMGGRLHHSSSSRKLNSCKARYPLSTPSHAMLCLALDKQCNLGLTFLSICVT